MADQNKFEEMLERLINEDKSGAEELFHEIVVEKSRDIYESLLENDLEEVADEEVDEATDEEVDETTEEEVDESRTPKTANEEMREYVEKVTASMGDNGANTKSTVAGANDMGGEAGNLVQGSEEGGRTADSAKDETAGNVNVPGGKASKSMKAQPKGHGAEKKGAGEAADNKKSTVGK